MAAIDRFDPFTNRLCRNVRNALSEGFQNALERKEMNPVQRIAGLFRQETLPAVVRVYIDQRLSAYEKVLAELNAAGDTDPLGIAVRIWNHRLFFETHEYLEPFWMAAAGNEKRLLQALIRAAGAYVHLEQGNHSGARRIADKALAVLETQTDRLARYLDPKLLLDRLRRLDPDPPEFT